MYYGADIRMRPGPQRGMPMIGTWVCTKSIRFLRFEKKKKKKPDIFPHIAMCSVAQLLKGAQNTQVCFHVKYTEAISVAGF